jgi:hypothetical protein
MEPKSAPGTPSQTESPFLSTIGSKSLETLTALAEVNQVVVGQLIELGSSALRETLRAYVEMQSASLDVARSAPPLSLPTRESLQELAQDPFTMYRRALLRAAEDTQRAAGLFETSAHIVSRGAERLNATADRAGKDIRAAVTSCTERIKDIYTPR